MTPAQQERLVALFGVAYAEPPYNETDDSVAEYATRLAGEVSKMGFDIEMAERNGDLIGATYGYQFAANKWWSHADSPPLGMADKPKFAVIEFIVQPSMRGLGIGRTLLTNLLSRRTEPFATLCSVPAAKARQMYEKWGWREVAKNRMPDRPTMDVLATPLPWN